MTAQLDNQLAGESVGSAEHGGRAPRCATGLPGQCAEMRRDPGRRGFITVLRRLLAMVGMALAVLSRGSGAPCGAAEAEANPGNEGYFDLSLEQLMDIEVVSAARQPQATGELSVPVTVVTAEDIHYAGCTNVAEALDLVPGVDLLRADRNRYVLGVRGLHHSFADRTLVLVNGRNAGSPIFGGCDFARLPLFVEDIERIEVVRGPGGAAWGANAFNGVVNIITKRPEQVPGGFASMTVNEFSDHYGQLRWAEQQGPWNWRLSTGIDGQESSEDALDTDRFTSDDFRRNVLFDGEGQYKISDSMTAAFGAAYADVERGSFDFIGVGNGQGDEQFETARLFARLEKRHEGGATSHLQWAGNFDNEERPSMWDSRTSENDLEMQLSLTPGQNHTVSVGGNVRVTRINTERSDPSVQLNYADEPFDEYRGGVFLIDRWQATSRLALEGQLRGDASSEANEDWSARLSALYALDDEERHVARVSFARAYREPLAVLREIEYIIPPPGFGVSLLKAEDLSNEEIKSFELGYTWQLDKTLRLELDGYFQRYEDLIGRSTIAPLPAGQRVFANIDGADALGGEACLTWEHEAAKVTAWYAYNDFQPDQRNQSIRAFGPAKHKLGISGRLFLEDGWTVNADFKAVGSTPLYASSATLGDIESYNALDLTLSKRFHDGAAELMVGVADLLDETGVTVKEGGGVAHSTPGRTFFLRAQFTF